MRAQRSILIRTVIHFLVAVPVFACGWRLLATAPESLAAVGQLLQGMACFLLAAIILAVPVATLVAQPTGTLFYPGLRNDRPQPNYSIVQAQVKRGHYEEALSAYEKLAAEYPGEIRPHIGMLEVALVHLKDPARASEIYHRAAARLKHKPDRDIVWQRYRQFASLLASEQDRQRDRTIDLPPRGR